MKIFHATDTTLLTQYRPVPDQVAHFFARINEDDSIYFASIFHVREDEGILVTRYGDQDLYRFFLTKTKTKIAYEKYLTIIRQKNWSELMACNEWLLATHRVVFEVFPIEITIVHSLDFMSTIEFNREEIFLDKKIYMDYERSNK